MAWPKRGRCKISHDGHTVQEPKKMVMGLTKSENHCLSSTSGSQAHGSWNIFVNGEADSGLVSCGKLLHQLAIHVILEHGHVAYIDLICQLCALIIPAGTWCCSQDASTGAHTTHQRLYAEGAAGQAQLIKLHARAPHRSTAWPPRQSLLTFRLTQGQVQQQLKKHMSSRARVVRRAAHHRSSTLAAQEQPGIGTP